MQVWSINELLHLTREELCNLSCRAEHALTFLEAGTVARCNALDTVNNIRRVMTICGFHYGS